MDHKFQGLYLSQACRKVKDQFSHPAYNFRCYFVFWVGGRGAFRDRYRLDRLGMAWNQLYGTGRKM